MRSRDGTRIGQSTDLGIGETEPVPQNVDGVIAEFGRRYRRPVGAVDRQGKSGS
ncbi:MAG: hypothetical protein QOH82_1512, partial [Mycobacterium sp.]|nr:hypothetical protein [Mycobacterium sp.]